MSGCASSALISDANANRCGRMEVVERTDADRIARKQQPLFVRIEDRRPRSRRSAAPRTHRPRRRKRRAPGVRRSVAARDTERADEFVAVVETSVEHEHGARCARATSGWCSPWSSGVTQRCWHDEADGSRRCGAPRRRSRDGGSARSSPTTRRRRPARRRDSRARDSAHAARDQQRSLASARNLAAVYCAKSMSALLAFLARRAHRDVA